MALAVLEERLKRLAFVADHGNPRRESALDLGDELGHCSRTHHAAAFIDSGKRILTAMPLSMPSLTASTIP
jgi:hypothetical protein